MNKQELGRVPLFQIHPDDNVVVATRPLNGGMRVAAAGVELCLARDVGLGAKVALRPVAEGELVLKYGEPIGTAAADIAPGEYVHTHNVRSNYIPTPWTETHVDGPEPEDAPC